MTLPQIYIRCDTTAGLVTGSIYLNVVRVEENDDGSLVAVTDFYPSRYRDEDVLEAHRLLRLAIKRIKLANAEGNPILSSWLPEAERASAALSR